MSVHDYVLQQRGTLFTSRWLNTATIRNLKYRREVKAAEDLRWKRSVANRDRLRNEVLPFLESRLAQERADVRGYEVQLGERAPE